MRMVELGRSGLKVSVVGVGSWQFYSRMWGTRGKEGVESAKGALARALELGINLVDTAEVYGGGESERIIGEVVGNRDDVVVTTKVAGYRTTEHSILKAARACRSRLRRDSIDLLLYHWPPPVYTPLCRVIRALERAVDEGVAAYIGVSNFPSYLLEKALACLRKHEIVANQVQYSLAYRAPEHRLKPLMDSRGISLIAWSPLAKGALAGKTKADTPARRGDKVFTRAAEDTELQDALENAASKLRTGKAQVAIAWLIAKGAIPIPGVRKPRHAEVAAEAASLTLPEDIVEMLELASERYLRMWGADCEDFKLLRLVPGLLQHVALSISGGI